MGPLNAVSSPLLFDSQLKFRLGLAKKKTGALSSRHDGLCTDGFGASGSARTPLPAVHY